MKRRLIHAGLAWAFVAFVYGWANAQDHRQDWIHKNKSDCCDHRDCFPAEVYYTPNGWEVKGSALLVPFKAAIAWPFALPYACWDGPRVRCLFLDNGG